MLLTVELVMAANFTSFCVLSLQDECWLDALQPFCLVMVRSVPVCLLKRLFPSMGSYCSTDSDDDREPALADMEDLGDPGRRSAPPELAASRAPSGRASTSGQDQPREMLTPPLRAALSKQGYKLIGGGPCFYLLEGQAVWQHA
jgi:hypothetical protein